MAEYDDMPLSPLSSSSIKIDGNLKLSTAVEDFKKHLVRTNDQENKLQLDPFPNNHDLALFAYIVYDDEENIRKSLKKYLGNNTEWMLLTTAKNSERLNGYFGAAFYNSKHHHVVVSHRGTELLNSGAWWTNLQAVLKNKHTGQLNSAITFASTITETLSAVSPEKQFQLSFTGHSLGGWLAQITTFSVKYIKQKGLSFEKSIDNSSMCHAHCVSFDNPGSREMLWKLKDNFDNRYGSSMSLEDLDITNFLSAPNKVNMCNWHVGVLYRLGLDFTKMGALIAESPLYHFRTHEMKHIYSAFQGNGSLKPDVSKCELFDWPIGGILKTKEETDFFTHATVANNYNPKVLEMSLELDGECYNKIRYYPVKCTDAACSVRLFTSDELYVLKFWKDVVLKYGIRVDLSFVNFHSNDLFSSFQIEGNKIIFESEIELRKTIRNCKQINRWFYKEMQDVIETLTLHSQQLIFKTATDFYVNCFKTCKFNFKDTIGFREFLESPLKNVLYVEYLSLDDYNFEIVRFYKIFEDTKKVKNFKLEKYTSDNNFLFLDCSCFACLLKYIKDDLIYNSKNIKLIVMDLVSDSGNVDIMRDLVSKFLKDDKKIVFISVKNLNSNMQKIDCHRVEVKELRYSQLINKSQQNLLNKKSIYFQNVLLSLREFLNLSDDFNDSMTQFLDNFLDYCTLKTLIIEDICIKIDKNVPMLCDTDASRISVCKRFTLENLKSLANSDVAWSNKNCKVLITHSQSNTATEEYLKYFCDEEKYHIQSIEGEEGIEIFNAFCRKNKERQIYWFHLENTHVFWQLFYDCELYKKRYFKCEHVLNLQPFQIYRHKNYKDYFVINMSKQTDKTQVENDLCCLSEIIGKSNLILRYENDSNSSELIKSKHLVHNFKVVPENGLRKYVWESSEGRICNIEEFVYINEDFLLKENDLYARRDQTVIIVDEPGMGKSTTFTHICASHHDAWHFRINLLDYHDLIRNLPPEITLDSVVNFLLKSRKYANNFLRKLIEYFLVKEAFVPLFILFDGFDELFEPDLENKMIKLLKFVQIKTKAIMWITTRQNKKEILQNALNIFSIEFQPLNERKQKQFLKMFWLKCLDLDLTLSECISRTDVTKKLETYIDELFKNTNDIFGDHASNFIGVPLQLRMLAEIGKPNLDFCKQQVDTDIILPNNIQDIFRMYVNKKIEIYFDQKAKLSPFLNKTRKTWLLSTLNKKLHLLAAEKFGFFEGNLLKEYSDADLIELQSTGLIYMNSSLKFDFIHATLKEFFFAEQLLYWLRKEKGRHPGKKPQIEDFLLRKVFLNSDFKIVRMFLNNFFALFTSSFDEIKYYSKNIIDTLIQHSNEYCNKYNHTPFHILVFEQCENIVAFLLAALNQHNLPEKSIFILTTRSKFHRIFHQTVLYFACKAKYDSVIQSFISFLESRLQDFQEQVLLSSFFLTSQSGVRETLNYFMSKLSKNSKLIPICIEICNKYMLIDDIHNAVKDGTLKIIEKCINTIGNNNYKRYLFSAIDNDEGDTVLHKAVKYNQTEIFKYLVANGADVHIENKHRMSTIAWCAKGKFADTNEASFEILKDLISKNVSIDKPNRQGITPFQHAAKNGQLQMVKYFIETLKYKDVNHQDINGNTALFSAIRAAKTEVVKYLLSIKGVEDVDDIDINIENRHSESPLHVAIKVKNIEIVQLLVKAGGVLNCGDNCRHENCVSVLCYAFKHGRNEIIEYLIEKGAKLKDREKSSINNKRNIKNNKWQAIFS